MPKINENLRSREWKLYKHTASVSVYAKSWKNERLMTSSDEERPLQF